MWTLAGFALVTQAVVAQKLREEYPWYTTGDEIHSAIQELSTNCADADFQVSTRSAVNGGANAGQQVEIDVVKISKKGSPGEKKAFFVFGEHARELISPETGLQFMRTLCGQGGGRNRELAERVLGSTSFVVLPNVNPMGRKQVENGAYCKRTNEDSVDLNRNWGDQHRDESRANKDDEMNPGPYGFSEPETQSIRDLVKEENPDIFLSIHSGAYFMGTPFGYTDKREPSNEEEMENLLAPISEKYCGGSCPYGGLAEMIGYKSIGCDIDFVKEQLNTKYAFTWEIYIGESARHFYQEKAHAHNENREMNDDAKQFFWSNGLNLLQNKDSTRKYQSRAHVMTPESEERVEDCFEQFNPRSEEETQQVTENWSGAFLTLCDEVASKGKAPTTSSSSSMEASPPSPTTADGSSTGSGTAASPNSKDTSKDTTSKTGFLLADSVKQWSDLFDKDGNPATENALAAYTAQANGGSGSDTNSKSQDTSQNPILHDYEQMQDTNPLPKVGFLSAFDSLKQWSEEHRGW